MLDHPCFIPSPCSGYGKSNRVQRARSPIIFRSKNRSNKVARKYAFDRVSRANYIFEKIRKFLEYLSSSTPHSVDEHRGFGWTRLQFESNRPGRYLMKRQSHFRIAISNSARQRRTRGRARRKEQRSRSRDKIIKTPLPRFVLKR